MSSGTCRESLFAAARRWRCAILGHRWMDVPILYKAWTARQGVHGDIPVSVPVTWVCDEVCVRCGIESWWPS